MSYLWYELKKRKGALVLLVLEILVFVSAFYIRTRSPLIIVEFAKIVNKVSWFRTLLGFDGPIEAITCQDVMFAVLTVFIIIMLWGCFASTAHSIIADKRMGVSDFFNTQSVSQTGIYIKKLIISIFICLVQLGVLWLMLERFSLYLVENVDYLRALISGRTARVMRECAGVSVLFVALGFLHGCLSKNNLYLGAIGKLMGGLISAAMFPNVINACITILQEKNLKTEIFEKLYDIFAAIRRANPLYWCNPGAIMQRDGSMLWWSLGFSVIAVAFGIFILQRRKQEGLYI